MKANLKYFFLTKGKGEGIYPLLAFDNALKNAGIQDYNLVKISSILPAGIKEKKNINLSKGSLIYTAYSFLTGNEKGAILSSACSIAIPYNKKHTGMIMEFSDFIEEQKARKIVQEMLEISMEKRKIKIKNIKTESVSVKIEDSSKFYCVFAGCCLW